MKFIDKKELHTQFNGVYRNFKYPIIIRYTNHINKNIFPSDYHEISEYNLFAFINK